MACWGQRDGGAGYHAAGLARGGEIAYPINSRTTGIVTLDVSMDAKGAVQMVDVVRDVPTLTSAAESAVKSWKFKPALANGQAAAGTVRVHVVFNPYNPGGVAMPNAPLQPASSKGGESSGEYQPADVKTASYATYPVNMVAGGTVILRDDGKVEGARALRSVGTLTAAATREFEDRKSKMGKIGETQQSSRTS
jgi:TonB family protein